MSVVVDVVSATPAKEGFVASVISGLSSAGQSIKSSAIWMGHTISSFYTNSVVPAVNSAYASCVSGIQTAVGFVKTSGPANYGISAFLFTAAILAGKQAFEGEESSYRVAWGVFSLVLLAGGGFFAYKGYNIGAAV